VVGLLPLMLSALAGHQARTWFDADGVAPGEEVLVTSRLSFKESVLAMAAEHWPRVSAARLYKRLRPRAPLPKLSLYDVNAREGITVAPFDHSAAGIADSFGALRRFMRCRRTRREHDMNPELIALLMRISASYKNATLHIISAHRYPDGIVTSPTSQHTLGNASDIRVPGVPVEALAERAKALGARGVGVYPKSRFVHVDVRVKPHSWRDDGSGDEDEREPSERAPLDAVAGNLEAGGTGAGTPALIPASLPAAPAVANASTLL
jgi:uncharacterized protein YcbK (DUF882 family)